MALTYDQLSAITKKHYVPKLIDNIFDSDPLLQRAKKKDRYMRISGGTSVMFPLSYALTTSAGWYTGAETLQTTDNNQITAAEFDWKQLYVNISIERSEELKNMGDAQVIDLVKAKTQIAEDTMTDYLGDGLYSAGTNAKSIVGTRGQLVGTGSTVGGISTTDNSWWRAQVDSTTTTLSLPPMQTMYNRATINNKSPTVGMATRTLFNSYWGLLQPQQRFTDSDTAKGGFQNLMFNGMPIISGAKVSSSQPLLFLNEQTFALKVHKDEDMRFEPFQKPVNQNVKTAKIYWMGAFGFDQLRANGAFTALVA